MTVKAKKTKRKGRGKGPSFERQISKLLSMWWSGGERDDIFWRSTTSGARSTVRQRQGKSTFGQSADITAQDPIGQPLLDFMILELKKGYTKASVADIIDKPARIKSREIEQWIVKVDQEAKENQTCGWGLIHRRPQREIMIYLPLRLIRLLTNAGGDLNKAVPRTLFTLSPERTSVGSVWGCQLLPFLQAVSPSHIREALTQGKSK